MFFNKTVTKELLMARYNLLMARNPVANENLVRKIKRQIRKVDEEV